MSAWPTWTSSVLIIVWIVALYTGLRRYRKGRYRHSLPLPPGPRGLPWVGNVIGINTSAPWLTYSDWSKKYGDLVHSRLMGKDVIVVNSEKIARDLLEGRSGIYSDRPYLATNDVVGVGFNTVILGYGDRWRLHRRFFHQTFRADAVPGFSPVLNRKACELLRRLLNKPGQLEEHVFEYSTSLILNCVYDYDPPPPPEKDEVVDISVKVLEIVAQVLTPGVAVVIGAIPALLHLPSWLPGMSFNKKLADAKEIAAQYVEKPFTHCLQNPPNGDFAPSMVRGALQSMEKKGSSPDESWMKALKEASATALIAASDTTNSVVMTIFLLMVAYPAVQEKVQAEIDAVVGRTRLPTLDDRPSLPYLDAVYREILRHITPAPLSAPHSTLEDDTYAGFHIPKGALVITNLWSMLHDESKYPNPHVFDPERFLNDDGSLKDDDVENIVFGFGRRVCVGRHFANASVWSLMAKVFAVFSILKPLDEHGAEIPVEIKFSGGATVRPLPFQYRIVPRTPGMDAKMLEELVFASGE